MRSSTSSLEKPSSPLLNLNNVGDRRERRREERRRIFAVSSYEYGKRGRFKEESKDQTSTKMLTNTTQQLHPTIRLREVLRQFYLSFEASELLETVRSSASYLDTPTSLHLLSHVAELSLKKQLEGEEGAIDTLVETIIASIQEDVHRLRIPDVGCVLWSVSSVPSVASAPWSFEILSNVAAHETTSKRNIRSYNTRELANILAASGKLVAAQEMSEGSQSVSQKLANIRMYNEWIIGELARRMHDAPNVRGAFTGPDFTDIITACDVLFSVSAMELEEGQKPSKEKRKYYADCLPVVVRNLLDIIAFTLRRHLANKHSLRNLFHVDDMGYLLSSYARLGYTSEETNGMLDATANWISSRLEYQPGVSFAQLAKLLQPYAILGHRSVAVPEMIRKGICMQLRRNALALHEHTFRGIDNPSQCVMIILEEPESTRLNPFVTILENAISLGCRIDTTTLHAMMPALMNYAAPHAEAQDISHMLKFFHTFGYDPGPKTRAMLSQIEANVIHHQ